MRLTFETFRCQQLFQSQISVYKVPTTITLILSRVWTDWLKSLSWYSWVRAPPLFWRSLGQERCWMQPIKCVSIRSTCSISLSKLRRDTWYVSSILINLVYTTIQTDRLIISMM